MTPTEQSALLHALKMLTKFVEKHPIGTSCTSCTFYKYKKCSFYDSVPPEEVVKVGCKAWEWDAVPF